ncbi:unnamed protein product [Dracunculus medinensis]|uniref:EGF-like domain-containing protein n=1 Tax=Dracunculus medinensis TaxID=318479 RepID=A0A0N4U9N0_DRAME|nr:unnamed protein product [Dracunculus medinensis]
MSQLLKGGCSTKPRNRGTVASARFADLQDCDDRFEGYCHNSGICKLTYDIAHRIIPICSQSTTFSCPTGFRGKQCEFINDPNYYYSKQEKNEIGMTTALSLLLIIILAICFASLCLYLYRM